MINFEELEDARDEITKNSLNGKEVKFDRLRKICIKMNDENNENFNVQGSDGELWRSVNTFFRQLGKSTI